MKESGRRLTSLALYLVFAGPAAAAGPSIAGLSRSETGPVTLGWIAETNAFNNLFFHVEGTPALGSNFVIQSPAIPESSSLVYTDSVLSAGSAAFYRVSCTPAYTSLNQPGAFASFAATNVNGLNTLGYAGAVFDGRYVYFVPAWT